MTQERIQDGGLHLRSLLADGDLVPVLPDQISQGDQSEFFDVGWQLAPLCFRLRLPRPCFGVLLRSEGLGNGHAVAAHTRLPFASVIADGSQRSVSADWDQIGTSRDVRAFSETREGAKT
jgi:hypothetical protein